MFLSGEEWRGPSQNWTLRGLLSCQLTLSSHSVLSLNHCAFDMWRIDPIHMLLNSISDSHLKGDFQHSGTCLTMSDSKAKDTRWALLHFSLLYGWLLVLCVIFLNWRKDKSRVNQPCCSRSQCCQSQFHCPLPYSLSFSYRSAHSVCSAKCFDSSYLQHLQSWTQILVWFMDLFYYLPYLLCPSRPMIWGSWCRGWRIGHTVCTPNSSLRTSSTSWSLLAPKRKCRWAEWPNWPGHLRHCGSVAI